MKMAKKVLSQKQQAVITIQQMFDPKFCMKSRKRTFVSSFFYMSV